MKCTVSNLKKTPIVWSVSGHDPSGGAGIAADLRTLHAFGVEACALITANTIQNSDELLAINPISDNILEKQYQALVEDKTPDSLKLGMLATDEQVYWIIEKINQLKVINPFLTVIYDPVFAATSGGSKTEVTKGALQQLFTHIDIITPNLPEAEKLTGIYLAAVDQIAKKFVSFGINQVVIKGGHSDTDVCTDYGFQYTPATEKADKYAISCNKVYTDYSHGSGCSFASALAALIAKGYLLRDALTITKAFMQQGLLANEGQIQYYGAFAQTSFPCTASCYPHVELTQPLSSYPTGQFNTLNICRDGRQGLGLYPVVDSLDWLEKLLPLSIEIIQLRIKNKSGKELDSIIEQAVALNKKFPETRLFINDHWQLAIKHKAYGIHLGQEDIFHADLAKIQQSGLRLGISTHGIYEFLLAQQLQPSYLAIGAIFPTSTKDMTGQIQGVDNLAHILNVATTIPVVAIGGINIERAEKVWQTGVDSIAVVTAITESENYQVTIKEFKAIMSKASKS